MTAPRIITLLKLLVAMVGVAAVGAFTGAAAARASTCSGTVCYQGREPDWGWSAQIGLPAGAERNLGEGVTVASIDTGVTPGPDLGARLIERVDLTADHDGIDHFGHGTHIAGLIAGSTAGYQGVAPRARLVSVKTAGWDGATDPTTVIAALRWIVSHRELYGIRVVNLSWGTDGVQSYLQDPLNRAIERAWRAGLVVVVAAGNGGPEGGTIAKPADDPFVITVGAADTHGTVDTADDEVAGFSARGTTVDGVAKPDLVAPGISLASERAPGSTIDTMEPQARVGDAMFKGSGTSQAAALVSGVAARVLSANPALSPDQVKALLLSSTGSVPAGDGAGAGLVDAAAAVAAAQGAVLPAPANAGVVFSSGSGGGSLAGTRGTNVAVTDLDHDGVAEPLPAGVDALGLPWTGLAGSWGSSSWPASPWAPLTTEIAGDAAAPPWLGASAPLLAWDPAYWGAASALQAGWDASTWFSRYWGSRYWGAAGWG